MFLREGFQRRLQAALFLLPLLLPWSLARARLHFNRSGSLPLGIYREVPGRRITYGSYVWTCLPPPLATLGRERGYLPSGSACPAGVAAVLKRVVALPGDGLLVSGEGLEVRGVPIRGTARRRLDRAGRVVPSLPVGRYRVPAGQAWVVGSDAESWDSRYYGPLSLAGLNPAEPVWVG